MLDNLRTECLIAVAIPSRPLQFGFSASYLISLHLIDSRMAQFHNDELEYMVDGYYDMAEFDDDNDFFGDEEREQRNDEDSEFEDDDVDVSKQKTDTSALDARNGKDIQGIPWERLNFTRDKYRETRLKQYKNYENLSRSRDELEKECKQVETKSTLYEFQFNTRLVKSTIVHFQVEIASPITLTKLSVVSLIPKPNGSSVNNNLSKAWLKIQFFGETTKCAHSAYGDKRRLACHHISGIDPLYMLYKELNVLDPLYMLYKELNVLLPFQNREKNIKCACSAFWIDSVPNGEAASFIIIPLMIKVQGSLWVPSQESGASTAKNLLWATSKHDVYLMQNYSVMHWSSLLRRGKEVINVAGPIVPTVKHRGSLAQPVSRVQISTMAVKDNMLIAGGFQGELICKNTSVSPDGKLLSVLGDSADCLVADAQSGKTIATLKGHLDYSFSSAWHPSGSILATGNQDTTCRLWDVRNLSTSLAVLKGRMGAIRAIKFTSDGRFMAMAEPADFVHIFDTRSDYCKGQEIDLFGEIAGISFSPDTEALFVGVADRTYGSLLEFKRRRCMEDGLMAAAAVFPCFRDEQLHGKGEICTKRRLNGAV
ncbi:hypothetical protein ACLOJK_013262 [Asimina triloba]